MTKRLISLFLALIMVVGVLPCTVFAVEPSAVIEEVDPATNTTLPQDGVYELTIVNDSYAPAKYTVSIAPNGGSMVCDVVNLAPKTKMTVAKINDGDTYSVDVEYPEYYAKKSDVACVFSSDGKSLETVGGEKWTHTVGATASTLQDKIYRATDSDGNPPKEKVITLSDGDCNDYATGKALWKTYVKWDVVINSGKLQFKANFGANGKTTAGSASSATLNWFEGSMDEYFYGNKDNYKHCTSIDTKNRLLYSLDKNQQYFKDNPNTKDTADQSWSSLDTKVKAARINVVLDMFKKDVLETLEMARKDDDDYDYFTYNQDLSVSNGALSGNKAIYIYQLVKQDGEEVKCDAADITLTYTLPAITTATVETKLDVLNAERYAGLAGINGEWITEILLNLQKVQASKAFQKFKEENNTKQFSAYIKAYPDVLLQVIPMETLAQAIATEQMTPAAITLTEVAEGNSFFEGNSYTFDPASDTDLVEPLFATFRLPEGGLKDTIEAAKNSGPTAAAGIGTLLEMFYLDGKKDTVKAASETDYPNLVSSTTSLQAELASNTKWLEKVNKQLQDKKYEEKLKNAISSASDILTKTDTTKLITDAINLLGALEGTKLPIRLGYTYNFSDVRPGKYQVSYDGPEGWSCDQVIEVCADGTIKGLETKRAAEIDLFQPINPDVALVDQRDTLDLIYHQMVGSDLYGEDITRIESSGSYTYTGDYAKVHSLAESFLKENDKPYALFSNSGVWVNHEGGLSSGVKTIEFTAVMPDGVTPMAGATYRLISRDQIQDLMGTLISLGRGAVEAAGDGTLSFDELVAKYKDLISGGKTGEITASYTDALVKTADKLKTLANLKLPVILEATSDAYGLVKFTMGDDASVRGLVETADLAVNATKNLGDKAAELIKDTIVGKINHVVKTMEGINENYYKPALKAKENITNAVNRVKKTVTDALNSIIARLKSFFGIVKRADAAELKDYKQDYKLPAIKVGGTEIDSELLDRLIRQTVDVEVFDVALELLGTIEALKKTVDDFTAIGKAVDEVTAAKNAWSNFITNGYESLKPGGGSGGGDDDDEKNKLDQFIDTLKQKIKDLNHTADTITETFGKLNPAINLLKGLGEQDHNVYDVANVVMDLLGVAIEGDDRFPDGNYILMQIAAPPGYTRSNVCYTLHVEKGRTTAQRGILTPLLETNSKALEAYVASLSAVNRAKLAKFQKGADSYLDRQAKLWDAMNYFSMTRVIANGVRDSIIADVAEAVFKAMPGCFVDVDAVELEIRTALKQVDSNPTFDELLEIADKMITKSTATVGRGWTVIAAVNVVDQIPA